MSDEKLNIPSKNLLPTTYNLSISPELSQRAYLNILEDMQEEKKQVEDQRAAIFNVLDDISEAKQKVEEEKARIDAAVQNLTDGLASFDENGKVLSVNPRMTALTGLPAEGFYLEELAKLFKGVDMNKKIKIAIEKRKNIHVEEVTLLGGRFFYEIFFTPVIDPQDKIIGSLILLHDITHLKEIDRMKTEFVSVASHQLRTPLTPIKLFSEMLLGEEVGKLNPKQKEYIEDISQSTKRMIKLVNDLLNVSRIETGRLKIEPKLIQIEDFIQNIIKEVMPVVGSHGCKIIFKKPKSKFPKIPIDPSLMRQVIHNLITNAIRYSSKTEGEAIVRLESRTRASSVRDRRQNRDYVISVADNGIGIPENVQSRIFEKFFRADNAQKAQAEGSGLGLYVAKMIVEASGGKIWFSSKGGSASGGESPPKGEKKGTIFYVSIPARGMAKKEGEKGLASDSS